MPLKVKVQKDQTHNGIVDYEKECMCVRRPVAKKEELKKEQKEKQCKQIKQPKQNRLTGFVKMFAAKQPQLIWLLVKEVPCKKYEEGEKAGV